MNVFHLAELQRRLDREGTPITAISVHPGTSSTGSFIPFLFVLARQVLTDHEPPLEGFNKATWWVKLLTYPVRIEAHEGGYTPLFAATSAEVAASRDKYKGRYLEPYGKLVEMSKESKDEGLARTLWGTSESVLKGVLG